jgi:hypothetical protein
MAGDTGDEVCSSEAVISWGILILTGNFAFQEVSTFLRSVNKQVCDTEQLQHATASKELYLFYIRYIDLS